MWELYRLGKYEKTFNTAEEICKYWRGLPLAIAGEYTCRFREVK